MSETGNAAPDLKLRVRRIADKENQRRRALASYYRKKAAGTLKAQKPISAAQKHRYNANRREKSARLRSSAAEKEHDTTEQYVAAGISIVGRRAAQLDNTVFQHRAAVYEDRIAQLGTEIIEGRIALTDAHRRAEKFNRSYLAARAAHDKRKKE